MFALIGIVMLMCIGDELSEQLMKLTRDPNLVTISALRNSHRDCAHIHALASTLNQFVWAIHSGSSLRACKAQETSLYNGVEKGLLGGKGIFTKPNALNAVSFEILLSRDARRGKILWYADTLFSRPKGLLSWSIRESSTLYTMRTLDTLTLYQEHLELFRDGRGDYERYENKRLVRRLRWNASGVPELDE
jgi:hypothetical protein